MKLLSRGRVLRCETLVHDQLVVVQQLRDDLRVSRCPRVQRLQIDTHQDDALGFGRSAVRCTYRMRVASVLS